jgi:hypothetical protein
MIIYNNITRRETLGKHKKMIQNCQAQLKLSLLSRVQSWDPHDAHECQTKVIVITKLNWS